VDDLFARSLLVVTGKGGVGKSTVAAALGVAAARRGLRTIVVEVAARDDVSRTLGTSEAAGTYAERAVSDQLHHMSIDPQRAMEEYVRQQMHVGALAGLLARSRIFTALTAATPGMRELLTIGKVWELAQRDRRTRGARPYDLVVLDAPATGHGLAMLQAPRTFASVARVGPVATEGRAVASFLGDPRRTAVLAVSTAEEMAVTETLELRARLQEKLSLSLALTVANAVVPHQFSGADERTLLAAPASPARHAALFSATWARHQRTQIARLRRGLRGVRLVTLPLVFDSALGPAAIEQFSRRLDR
jgi:anion-transporting  ArsA/GET3 family ATPase